MDYRCIKHKLEGMSVLKFTINRRIFLFIGVFVIGVIGGFIGQYLRYSSRLSDMNFYSIILVAFPISIMVAFFDKILKRKLK